MRRIDFFTLSSSASQLCEFIVHFCQNFHQWPLSLSFCRFRTKIQAQRKFAQGQQPPSSAYLTYLSANANQDSSEVSANNEKSPEKEIRSALPIRPTTEDFLTFLCFRQTSALPRELDFDNSTYSQPQPSTSKASPAKKTTVNDKKKTTENSNKKTIQPKKNEEQQQREIDPKTGFIPFAVRKRAEIHPVKLDNKKTNSATKKAAAAAKKDEIASAQQAAAETSSKSSANNVSDKTKNAPSSSKTKTIDSKKSAANEKRATRNTPVLTSTPKSQEPPPPTQVRSEPKTKKAKVEVDNNLNSTDSKLLLKNADKKTTDNSSDTVVQPPPVKSNRGRKKKIVDPKPPEVEKAKSEDKPEGVPAKKKKTRMSMEVAALNSSFELIEETEGVRGRPMRKTKEAATIYMELIGRKLTLHDSSDENSTLDSLEVPNLKKVEQMELEMKTNVELKNKANIINSNKPSISSPVVINNDSKASKNATKNLNKSFSDSDEEPLASKVVKKPAKPPGKKRGRKSNQELAEIAAKKSKEISTNAKLESEPEPDVKTSVEVATNSKVVEIVSIENEANDKEPQASNVKDSSSFNLLPSKEESEKIFGIASITLAQSCGPLDTKCTLGKCGSLHTIKPPVATPLTESALGSPKDRRKSKVSMTRDQIQKWLEEASWTPIPNDDLDLADNRTISKASSSVGLSKSGEDSQSSSNLKQEKCDQPSSSNSKAKDSKARKETTSTKLFAKLNEKIKSTFSIQDSGDKSLEIAKPEPKVVVSEQKSRAEKKTPVYNQSPRTPVYNKTPETKPSSKLTPVLPKSLGAFSPENEHSIYSFDREDEELPATPFRRHNSKSDENVKSSSTPAAAATAAAPKQTTSTTHVSLSLSPDDNKKSAAISIDLLNTLKKSSEKQTIDIVDKDDDSDSEGHTFYIPLQASSAAGSKTIQGVAVKLGTEGEEGPNQRIIMHAKLVTKSRANATPLPESMSNVQELVKTLMASKDLSKSVPCATVQPRFKRSESSEVPHETQQQPPPSTSNARSRQQSQPQPPPKQGTLQEAPIFRPTEAEFNDPIEYIEKITPIASPYGICRIIPPDNFKPECRISDEMRFNAYNQYVHKMLHRWGPSAKEFSAIKKYLATQSMVFQRPPLIAGIEVDLPRLYHTVQELGGLKEVIEKKKWAKVAEEMCIPKTAHDRATKLDDIYCKYLLPYDTLSQSERQKLFDEVEAEWSKKEAKARRNADKTVESDEQSNEDSEDSEDDEDDDASMECMVKGKSMALSQFYRVARNMLTLWFKTPEPPVSEIEAEYWRHVAVRDSHVCVHYGSIDSSGYGYGFPMPGPKTKSSPCSKHPWNLKVFTNNQNSILRSLGPVMGVTIPTLHVGMLFSAVCWYRDPHGLPWIEYLHTGASKIWYAVPDSQSQNFRTALTSLVPSHCQNKTIWLPCDTAMVRA